MYLEHFAVAFAEPEIIETNAQSDADDLLLKQLKDPKKSKDRLYFILASKNHICKRKFFFPGDHGAHEALVARHVDHRRAPPVVQGQRREAQLDGDPPGLLLGQAVTDPLC